MKIDISTPKNNPALKAAVSAILGVRPERDELTANINAINEKIQRLPDGSGIRAAEGHLEAVQQSLQEALLTASAEGKPLQFDHTQLEKAKGNVELERENYAAADRVRQRYAADRDILVRKLEEAVDRIRSAEEGVFATFHAHSVAAERQLHDALAIQQVITERAFREMQARNAGAAGERLKAIHADNDMWRNTRMAAIHAAIEEHWQQIVASIPE